MAQDLYFEDFSVGQQLPTDTFTFSKENAVTFAKEYDPQFFHVDEEAARGSFFGKLAVSGWHTAVVTMRLKTTSKLRQVAGGLVGLGLDSMKWPRPVYPGDTVHSIITIVDKRPSKSKPAYGVVKYRVETFNQRNELVLEMVTNVIMPRREA